MSDDFVVDFPTLGFLVADWIAAHCPIPDGFRKGEPFDLYTWQLWALVNHYRVRPEATLGQLAPAFFYRRSQIVAPQKALALDTAIATPGGWTTMGDVQPGAEVFDDQGRPTRVLAKSQIFREATYRITFSDHSEIVAGGDHEWIVDRRNRSGRYIPMRVSTKSMLDDGILDPEGARRYRVAVAPALELPEVDLPIDPYVLGAWLGDGESNGSRITGLDDEVFDRIESAGHEVHRPGTILKRRSVRNLTTPLRLAGLKNNKHIPKGYLRASRAQRTALLQGLMDTDGYADRLGACEFTTVTPALRDGMMELLASLGFKPVCGEGLATINGRVTGPKWRIGFKTRRDIPVFWLERKQSRLKLPGRNHAQYAHRRITAIERIETVPTQCLTVEAESHAFLAGREMIPTGNSGKGPMSAALVAAEGLGPVIFNGWASGGEVYRCTDHGCGCGFEFDYEPGDPMGRSWATPLIQLLATSEDQTDNVFRPLQSMAKNGPLSERMRVGEEFIRLPNDGKIEVVTSSALARLGNPINFALQDESGLYTRTNKLLRVAETMRRGAAGMGGRSMETTNAWDPAENSTAQQTSESRRPDIFKFHRLPPSSWSYKDKRDRRRIHKFVYSGSTHVDLDAIEAEAAELLETDPTQAERFFGNRIVHGHGSWLVDGLWDSCRAS